MPNPLDPRTKWHGTDIVRCEVYDVVSGGHIGGKLQSHGEFIAFVVEPPAGIEGDFCLVAVGAGQDQVYRALVVGCGKI